MCLFDTDLANKKINVIPLEYYITFDDFFAKASDAFKTSTYKEMSQKELSQFKEFIQHINIKIK